MKTVRYVYKFPVGIVMKQNGKANGASLLGRPRLSKSSRGIALILVLGFLVLITGLVVAFFSSVTTELGAASSYAAGASTKQLADSAVEVVMAQIKTATSGSNTAWASQPGMIRTYDDTGKSVAGYKLYSSSSMVVATTGTFNPGADVPPAGWDKQTAFYTDLNARVITTTGTNYPIVDPRAEDELKVEGFEYKDPKNPAPVATGTNANPLPMPVRWLYMLKDGTLTVPDDPTASATTTATFTGKTIPTASNPIVGRIAFWTDDETSKININTAAGDEKNLSGNTPGSFWDMPRAYTDFDVQLANSQVAQFEFQRYPGHPSTIALNAIFPTLTRSQIAAIAPKVAEGGSLGGTRTFSNIPGVVKPDADRLYASVDELFFKMPLNSGAAREQNLPAVITPEAVQRTRFFLTAQSRAPELNLFGMPRVGIWPIHTVDSTTTRTASDNLLAFCSTIGGKAYYFTRGAAGGLTKLTNYNRTADFSARNSDLYEYLRKLTQKPVPGFGGPSQGFVSKYTALERDQILTEMYDYIRSTNLVDGLLASAGGQTYTQPKKDASGQRAPGSGQAVPIKITTSNGVTKGFGRFATISEAALQFYATELTKIGAEYRASKIRAVLLFETFSPAQGHTGITPEYYHVVTGLNALKVTVPGTAQPVSLNFPSPAENHITELESMHGRIWSGTEGVAPTFFRAVADPGKKIPGLDPTNNYAFISQSDIPIEPKLNPVFSFSGGDIKLAIEWRDSASGGRPTQQIQTINLRFPPGNNWPLPKGPTPPSGGDPLKPPSLDYNWRIAGLNKHDITEGGSNPFQSFARLIDQADTVRSLDASGICEGDLRLVEGREADVPPTFYLPHRDYSSTNLMQAHGLRLGVGYTYPYRGSQPGTTGKLVAAATYGSNIQPDMPASLSGTGAMLTDSTGAKSPGDWDTGMASYLDGPYINKPDEGTTSPPTSSTVTTPYFTNTDDFDAKTLFSPNRQIASPIMFGSLSTGVIREKPWQTLLFRPDGGGKHPGSAEPKDHLLLDLFTMPIVEPYAISEPCSTAGKVNMNYQIAPFGYIRRETAMRAALQAIWTMAIPTDAGPKYKNGAGAAPYRSRVDATETLAQFQKRFDDNRLFVSASEICDLELVPDGSGVKAESMATAYWPTKLLTGDNVREMPYNHLYPLLTTKSNTYTVHFRVQRLKKSASTPAAQWDEVKDQVVGEYRGSTLIERYVDPGDPMLPDFATLTASSSQNLDSFYKFRVVSTKKFAP